MICAITDCRMELTTDTDIYKICQAYGIKNYTICADGSIDVDGDVYLSNKRFDYFPIQFNYVMGSFTSEYNKLKSLKGAPRYVKGRFCCSNNNLSSLEYLPEFIGGSISLTDNDLTSLVGCPEKAESLVVYRNKLTSLGGCPIHISGDFMCSDNPIDSLLHFPKTAGGYLGIFDKTLIPDYFIKTFCGLPKDKQNLVLKYMNEVSVWDNGFDKDCFDDLLLDIEEGLQ